MKVFARLSGYLLVSVLFRIFMVFICATKFFYRFWPTDTLLYSYEIVYISFAMFFWILPVVLVLEKARKFLVSVVIMSFLPEIILVLAFPLMGFFSLGVGATLRICLYVAMPIFFLSEISFCITYAIFKSSLKNMQKTA